MTLGTRISVIGSSGSGKSWTASRLASALGLPHTQLDAIRHGPNWTELPDDDFREAVAAIAATDAWVVDGNYAAIVRDTIWSRATDVLWLDYPRRTVMPQVFWRSLTRAALRRELWNGNREQFRNWIQPWHPIRWSWSTHGPNRTRESEWLARYAGLNVTRLTSRRATRDFLAGLTPRTSVPSGRDDEGSGA